MKKRYVLRFAAWITVIAITALVASCSPAPTTPSRAQQTVPATLTVSAAASLKDALQAIQPLYGQQQPQVQLTYNFGASGSLQRQIEQGAPVDVFISAAAKQMDALQQNGFLVDSTRQNLLQNRVVLIVPKDADAVTGFQDLVSDRVKKVAIGEPQSVPAGKYAQEVLTSFKIFQPLQPKLVFGKDVRQVLSYVETGNVDAGIVYKTDAKRSNQVKMVATAPETSHSPVLYAIAVVKASKNTAAAKEFVQFLSGSAAGAVFEKSGFLKPAQQSAGS